MVKKVIFIFILFISGSTTLPQDISDPAANFDKAINLFDAGNYQDALELFDKVADNPVFNPKTTISLLFKGKTLLRLNNFTQAELSLLKFIELYPSSNYIDEARLTLAKAYYENRNYFSSFRELVNLLSKTNSSFYENYSKAAAEKVAVNYLIAPDVKRIYDASDGSRVKSFLLLTLGKVNLSEGDINTAKQYLLEVTQSFPNSDESSEASTLIRNINNNLPVINNSKIDLSSSLIGIILPLNGEKVTAQTAAIASEILKGIKYAVSEFNLNRESNKIGIVVKNTALDNDSIKSIKNEFESIPLIKVIIGPIFSDEVNTAIKEFDNTDIPIISPTATDTGLTLINENFFQANPPFSLRGRIMAEYIYYVENKRRMAVYHAEEGYSPLLASTFIEEFSNLGGEIFAKSSYKSNSFKAGDSVLVKPISEVRDTLEGIYLPLADKFDAPYIFSQLVQQKTLVPLYGNQDWFFAKGYETSPELSNNLTFTSDYYIDYNGTNFNQFSKDFFEKTKSDPNRNALYGYDTAKYILTVMRNSGNSRTAIKSKMESGIMSRGFHNNISFSENHINSFLNIVRYNKGKFELIDKFRLSN